MTLFLKACESGNLEEVKTLVNLFISTGRDPVSISLLLLERLRYVKETATKSLFFKNHSVRP